MGAGLTLRYGFTELAFQIAHIVVLEHGDHGTGKTGTEADGGVIELVGNHEAALSDNGGEGGGVGNKTH